MDDFISIGSFLNRFNFNINLEIDLFCPDEVGRGVVTGFGIRDCDPEPLSRPKPRGRALSRALFPLISSHTEPCASNQGHQ